MQFQDLTQKYNKCMLITHMGYFEDLSYLKNASKLQQAINEWTEAAAAMGYSEASVCFPLLSGENTTKIFIS